MEPLSLDKFEPTFAKLQELAKSSAVITLKNPEDKEQVQIVHDKRIELRDARVEITKRGKELRDDANKFARAVIAKEKELIAVIGPEEDRLEKLEDGAKDIIARKARLEAIPTRRERLKELGVIATDEELMEYDDDGFKTFVNAKVEEKNEQERQKLEAEKAKIEAERLAMEREKEMREREERAREEERQKASLLAKQKDEERKAEEKRRKAEAEAEAKQKIEDAKVEAQRIEREAKEKVEREERERKEKEEAERKAREELEKKEKYKEFRLKHGWSEETKHDFIEQNVGEKILLYKKVGEFKIK